MRVFRYIIFAALLSITCSTRAQVSLHIDPNALDSLHSHTFAQSNAISSDTVSLGIWLYNQTGTSFSGTVSFDYTVSRGGIVISYNSDTSNLSGIRFAQQSVAIGPQSGALLNGMRFNFSNPVFVVGTSTVVIWPIVANAPGTIVDSASTQITVTGPSGITDEEMRDTKAYLFGSQLYIHSPENISGDLRIYDVTGNLLTAQKISQNAPISMAQYATGVYAVELTLSDGRRAVYKVFNNPMP